MGALKKKAAIFLFFKVLLPGLIIMWLIAVTYLFFGNSINDQFTQDDMKHMMYDAEADDFLVPAEGAEIIYDENGAVVRVNKISGDYISGGNTGSLPLKDRYSIGSRSHFGPRDTSNLPAGASKYHKGVDMQAPLGTPVYAAKAGTIVKAGWGTGYGNVIYIQHFDGTSTRYGHLNDFNVSEGQVVGVGQQIGEVGSSGVSSGPHLHFEYLINGTQVDPELYFDF